MGGFALAAGDIEEGLVGDGFDVAVTEHADGKAESADEFGLRDALLNFGGGEGAAGADGAIVHQRAADDLSAVRDCDAGCGEAAVSVVVSDAQLGDLASAAGNGVLVAFAAGLRVVER